MRAIVMTAFGGPEVLRLTDIPEPEPEHGQIRVRLYAAGVNPAEAYIRTGQYAFFKPILPYTPGFDGAGVVDKVGEGVQGSKPGDRVFVTALTARRNTGTYAEKVVCDAEAVHLLPDAVTLEQGAAVGFPGMAAYRALFQCAGLKPAERILIHGASGGVGTVAAQLARACGAFVIGTAGALPLWSLSAHRSAYRIDHTQPGYLDTLAALTSGGAGCDSEMLADKNLENDMRMIAKHGRIVVIGSRGSLEMTPRLLMAKESVVMGMAIWHSAPEEARMAEAAVAAALRSGALRPVLGDILPLKRRLRHMRTSLRGGKPGKMLLRIE
ncbi:MAG: NADPH:quinone reductase [Bilophila wadsworthia]